MNVTPVSSALISINAATPGSLSEIIGVKMLDKSMELYDYV